MCMREDREVVEMMIRLPYRRGGPPMASACQTHSFPPISVATRYRENIRIYHCPRMPAFIARAVCGLVINITVHVYISN